MTVWGETLVSDFTKKHERARKPFARFLEILRAAEWKHLLDVKASFPATDIDSANTYIFDIGGKKYRVIAAIDFEEQVVVLESVLTHEQYNRR